MLLGFTGTRATAHTDVLDCAAKTCHLVALEVVKADKYIGIHNGATYLGRLHIFTTLDRDINIIGTLQAIANQYGAAYRQRSKTIFPRTIEMLQCILSTSWIHRVTVGQEGFTSQLLDYIYYGTSIIRTQVTDITQLSEMEFYRNKLTLHIQILDARLENQLLEFSRQTITVSLGAKIGKEYFRLHIL